MLRINVKKKRTKQIYKTDGDRYRGYIVYLEISVNGKDSEIPIATGIHPERVDEAVKIAQEYIFYAMNSVIEGIIDGFKEPEKTF